MNNLYVEFKERKQEKINNFDMFFAFDNKQLENGLEKLNVNKNEIVSIGMNGFIRKTDVQKFKNMLNNFKEEHTQNMKNDDYVYHMFKYEMANHEYIITYDDEEEILEVCNVNENQFIEDEKNEKVFM
jgi:deoxycytidylate deaminase